MITQQRLKEILEYNTENGEFTWLISKQGVKKGSVAGSVSKKDGYVSITVEGRCYRAHRLAWLYVEGYFPPDSIDHRNRKTGDNCWENLRLANHLQNANNRDDNLPVMGVYKTRYGWQAWGHRLKGIRIYLGYCKKYEDAVALRLAYDVKNPIAF